MSDAPGYSYQSPEAIEQHFGRVCEKCAVLPAQFGSGFCWQCDDRLEKARAAEAKAVEAMIEWVGDQVELAVDDAHHIADWNHAMLLGINLDQRRAERMRLEGET